jgi:GPH family glycoside/pentoside/hexuronide:cation symporter
MWFAAAGMPAVILLPAMLERLGSASRADQVAAMGWILILLAPVSVLLVLRFIPEPPVNRDAPRRATNPLRQFGTMLTDRTLLVILILYGLVGVADASSAGTFVFFVERVIGLEHVTGSLLLIQASVALIGVPIWAMVSRAIGKERALAGVFAWNALSAPLALLLPAGNAWLLALFLIARNLSWGADYMLLRALVADVAGRDAEQTGDRRSGSYYALFNVTLKLAAAIGIGAALGLLADAGFVPTAKGSTSGLIAVRLVYALPSAVAGLAGLAILIWRRAPAQIAASTPAIA